jgi:hypothetical protein
MSSFRLVLLESREFKVLTTKDELLRIRRSVSRLQDDCWSWAAEAWRELADNIIFKAVRQGWGERNAFQRIIVAQ